MKTPSKAGLSPDQIAPASLVWGQYAGDCLTQSRDVQGIHFLTDRSAMVWNGTPNRRAVPRSNSTRVSCLGTVRRGLPRPKPRRAGYPLPNGQVCYGMERNPKQAGLSPDQIAPASLVWGQPRLLKDHFLLKDIHAGHNAHDTWATWAWARQSPESPQIKHIPVSGVIGVATCGENGRKRNPGAIDDH